MKDDFNTNSRYLAYAFSSSGVKGLILKYIYIYWDFMKLQLLLWAKKAPGARQPLHPPPGFTGILSLCAMCTRVSVVTRFNVLSIDISEQFYNMAVARNLCAGGQATNQLLVIVH